MSGSPQFTISEAGGAQLQALNTLVNCGWRYVTRAEGDQWRDGRRTLPFLETQLRADLARINRIQHDGRAHSFSEANIDAAVRRLAEGIPTGAVDVKASHVSSEEGISQQTRSQKTNEGVPAFFYSAQLLIAANSHDPRYGTVGTPRKLWSVWKEKEDAPDFISEVVNRS